jgi:hypothetical protein
LSQQEAQKLGANTPPGDTLIAGCSRTKARVETAQNAALPWNPVITSRISNAGGTGMSWQWLIFGFVFIVGLAVYFPVIYIRKTNRVLELLERIERNTRDAAGPQSIARDLTRAVNAE